MIWQDYTMDYTRICEICTELNRDIQYTEKPLVKIAVVWEACSVPSAHNKPLFLSLQFNEGATKQKIYRRLTSVRQG